jgi:ketosteroid isomerase-like protein
MTAADWIEGYKKAWASNAPDDIRALFTDDATYLTSPMSEPRVGVDAIVAGWIDDADAPGDATFEYEVLSDDGELAFVQGVTEYVAPRSQVYLNLWVIRFAADGRATEYTEWYMERKAR